MNSDTCRSAARALASGISVCCTSYKAPTERRERLEAVQQRAEGQAVLPAPGEVRDLDIVVRLGLALTPEQQPPLARDASASVIFNARDAVMTVHASASVIFNTSSPPTFTTPSSPPAFTCWMPS